MLPPLCTEPVFLVPGQGGDPRGALLGIYQESDAAAAEADRILEDIQQTVDTTKTAQPASSVRAVLLAPSRSVPADHEVGLLAGYAISVILARLLTAAGMAPAAIVGVSFGEIAAMVCGGAFDVADGARAVLALNAAYRPAEGRGAMVVVTGAGEEDCRRLLAESGIDDLVLACVNSPDQTVVSGPAEAVEKLLAQPGPKMTRLPVPYCAHHPALGQVRESFLAGMRELRQRPLRVPVHSPTQRRAYADGDDLREALADSLIKPVYLPQALRHLGAEGQGARRLFIELGAGKALVRCVQRTLPGAQTIAPLAGDPRWLASAVL
jgi:[acyl-carrier-protein] S-malonyltransferase